MGESLPEIPGITCDFPRPDGFARPDWERVHEWVKAQSNDGYNGRLYAEIEAAWAEDLGASISSDYNSYVSDNVILVSPRLEGEAIATTAFCERVHAWLSSVLGVMPAEVSGRHVIVQFDDPEEYWEYCSWFYPEGEFGASAGMTIKDGCIHVAVAPSYDGVNEEIVIAHEMLHSFAAERALPLWLEEGVAQRCERQFFRHLLHDPERESFQRIAASFTESSIDRFWSGDAFGRPRDDDEQKAAYEFALILANVILHDFSNARSFFEHATWDDAGESAAREHLGVSLAELVANILGPGDWAPRPEAWPPWETEAAAGD